MVNVETELRELVRIEHSIFNTSFSVGRIVCHHTAPQTLAHHPNTIPTCVMHPTRSTVNSCHISVHSRLALLDVGWILKRALVKWLLRNHKGNELIGYCRPAQELRE